MIKVESTQHSTVVWCTACPSWVAGASSRQMGLLLGADHEKRVHPESTTARNALYVANWRGATRRNDKTA